MGWLVLVRLLGYDGAAGTCRSVPRGCCTSPSAAPSRLLALNIEGLDCVNNQAKMTAKGGDAM